MTVNHLVAGSSPARGAISECISVGRESACQAEGQEFEPPHSLQSNFIMKGKMKQSHIYVLIATVLSLALSIYLFFFMDSPDAKLYGIYVGLWVPSILGAFRVIETGREDVTD